MLIPGALDIDSLHYNPFHRFQDLNTIHHELGHIQYQQQYKTLPQVTCFIRLTITPRNWAPKKNVNDLMFQPSGLQRRNQWRVPWGNRGIDGNGWSHTITSFQVLCLDFPHRIFTLSKILGSRKGQDVDWMFLGLVWEWYTSVSSALASWTTLYKMKS